MSDPNLGSTRPFRHLPDCDPQWLADFLRRVHPQKTATHVEAQTGVSEDTVKNWLKGRNQVSGWHLSLLIAVYGPNVLKAMWSGSVPGWLDSAVQAEAVAKREAQKARLDAEIAAIKSKKVASR